MKKISLRAISGIVLTTALVATTSVPGFPDSRSHDAADDVVFQFIGQASVPLAPPTLAQAQYGYLTYINRLSENESIFNPGPQNETTALFTFYGDTAAERVTNNGPIRVIDRTGTMTIYLDTTPDGDFGNPDSFRDGVPLQTSELRLQFILDTLTGAFNVVSAHTITSSDDFQFGYHNFSLGKSGEKFKRIINGHVTAPGTSPAAHLAGFAVGELKIRRRREHDN
jgi:hypothetical protein